MVFDYIFSNKNEYLRSKYYYSIFGETITSKGSLVSGEEAAAGILTGFHVSQGILGTSDSVFSSLECS